MEQKKKSPGPFFVTQANWTYYIRRQTLICVFSRVQQHVRFPSLTFIIILII